MHLYVSVRGEKCFIVDNLTVATLSLRDFHANVSSWGCAISVTNWEIIHGLRLQETSIAEIKELDIWVLTGGFALR